MNTSPTKYPALSLALLAAMALAVSACGGGGAALQARPQTIAFGTAPVLSYKATATVAATASSGLAVSYSSLTPQVCSVDAGSGLVTSVGTGTCTVAADQAGSDQFAPAAQATLSLATRVDPAQTIAFGTAPSLGLYGTAVVQATASSGLAVIYSSLSPSICRVDATQGVVTSLAQGNCSIAADQPGDALTHAAPQASQILPVGSYAGSAAAPGIPTLVTATLGTSSSSVVVRFFGPTDSGGSPVTSYTVRSSDGNWSATGADSPITVSCASTCNGLTFAVQASNGTGTGALSAATHVLTSFRITTRWYEPDTQPNDSIFEGSFTLDSSSGTVVGLQGTLTESMTGSANGSTAMTTVSLNHQLATTATADGGLLVSSFALPTTQVFSPGGYADTVNGLFYGYPGAYSPSSANSFVTVYIPLANPTAALGASQINRLVYGDCAPGGMMGDVCMTGVQGGGTMGGYPVSQRIVRQ